MRLPSHETGFDLANSRHSARYRDNAIEGLLSGKEFKQTAYALDRDSRKAALARFLRKAEGKEESPAAEEERLAA